MRVPKVLSTRSGSSSCKTIRGPLPRLTSVEQQSYKVAGTVLSDCTSLVTTIKTDTNQSSDKRFRIVVSMLREGFMAEKEMC